MTVAKRGPILKPKHKETAAQILEPGVSYRVTNRVGVGVITGFRKMMSSIYLFVSFFMFAVSKPKSI